MADDKLHEQGMDDSIEGKAKDVKGRVKDAAGGLTGDESLQAEGKWDRVKGKVQDKFGKVERELSKDDEDVKDVP